MVLNRRSTAAADAADTPHGDTADSKDVKSSALDAISNGSAAAGDDAGSGGLALNGQRNPLQNEWTMWYEVSKKSKGSTKVSSHAMLV